MYWNLYWQTYTRISVFKRISNHGDLFIFLCGMKQVMSDDNQLLDKNIMLLHKIFEYAQNTRMCTKYSNVHNILECAQNTRMCTKYSNVHKILECAQHTRMCAKYSNVHNILECAQNTRMCTPYSIVHNILECAQHTRMYTTYSNSNIPSILSHKST